MVQLSYLYMTTGKTIALSIWNFVGKVMSLLFNMLFRFFIAFLPRSKCLLISWLQLPSTVIFELKKIVCHCSILFPIYFPWSDGTRCHDLSFLNVEFRPAFSQYTALMYSFPNFEPVHCSMYGSNCCFLTCIQVSQEASKVVWYPHLFKNFPQFVVIHTVKGFSVVS